MVAEPAPPGSYRNSPTACFWIGFALGIAAGPAVVGLIVLLVVG